MLMKILAGMTIVYLVTAAFLGGVALGILL